LICQLDLNQKLFKNCGVQRRGARINTKDLKEMRNRAIIFLLCSLFISVIIISGCDDTLTSSIDGVTIPSSNVSYSKYIQPVLTLHCAISGCHTDQDRAGGLSLTSYANTTSDYLIVAAKLPANSKLYLSINGLSGTIMPPLGSSSKPLNSNQIAGIKTWITEGAKNN